MGDHGLGRSCRIRTRADCAVRRLANPSTTGKLQTTKYLSMILWSGVFTGPAAAALVDRHRIVESRVYELPVARVQQIKRRKGIEAYMSTLSPSDPTYETSESYIRLSRAAADSIKPGLCLRVRVEKGQLGGSWETTLSTSTCAKSRGRPSTIVVVLGGFNSWRWYNPDYGFVGVDQDWIDAAMAPSVTCLTKPGGWLYLCSSRSKATTPISNH